MARVILILLIALILATVIVGYIVQTKKGQSDPSRIHGYHYALAFTVLLFIAVLGYMVFQGHAPEGTYHPPTMENGKINPAYFD